MVAPALLVTTTRLLIGAFTAERSTAWPLPTPTALIEPLLVIEIVPLNARPAVALPNRKPSSVLCRDDPLLLVKVKLARPEYSWMSKPRPPLASIEPLLATVILP